MMNRLQLRAILGNHEGIIDFVTNNVKFQKPDWIYELKYLIEGLGSADETLEYIKEFDDPREVFMNSKMMIPYIIASQKEIIDTMRKDVVVEGIFTCKNSTCRSRRTLASSKQTRSADEAATVTVVCTVCHTKWVLH